MKELEGHYIQTEVGLGGTASMPAYGKIEKVWDTHMAVRPLRRFQGTPTGIAYGETIEEHLEPGVVYILKIDKLFWFNIVSNKDDGVVILGNPRNLSKGTIDDLSETPKKRPSEAANISKKPQREIVSDAGKQFMET